MAKIMTLGDAGGSTAGLGAPPAGAKDCKCVYNPRTKRSAQLCFVGKSKKNRSGFAFVKGGASRCRR